MKIYGFTLLRNGIKYDYPFLESLRSLCALCDTVYLALGKSEDGTEAKLAEFKNLKIIPTVWDEAMRKSGLILSIQTNIALEALRADHKEGWGIYLQADEVLSERDFATIRQDIQNAEASGCDSISFRYLHFWQSYHRIATDWRWYPQEVRAIRLNSAAKSAGDAQGFSDLQKKWESDAFVYHYGHVREASAYEKKKSDFGRWWHNDEELVKVLKKGAKRDRHETTISYLGPHPSFMKERLGADNRRREKVLVYGDESKFLFLKDRVKAEIEWTTSLSRALGHDSTKLVVLEEPPFWTKLFPGMRSKVPSKMSSPRARDFTPDFRAILRFSEKGISVQ